MNNIDNKRNRRNADSVDDIHNVDNTHSTDSMCSIDDKDNLCTVHFNGSDRIIDIRINGKLWDYLNSDTMKYSKIEAFCHLVQQVLKSDNRQFYTSVNKLSKLWKWDNHTSDDFLEEMKQLNVFTISHAPKGIVICITPAFGELQDSFPSLFNLVSSEERKASRVEAILYLLEHPQDSNRCIARELGWSHHSMINLSRFIHSNGDCKHFVSEKVFIQ